MRTKWASHGVSGPARPEQGAHRMRLFRGEADHLAATQEPPELGLLGGAAHLGDNQCRGDRGDAQLQPGPVVRPDVAIPRSAASGTPSVVGDVHCATRQRAAAISASVNVCQRPVFGFPFSHGLQLVADEQCTPGGIGHPRRNADAIVGRGSDDLPMHVGVNRDRQPR